MRLSASPSKLRYEEACYCSWQGWIVVAGLFVPVMKEIVEMLYLTKEPRA